MKILLNALPPRMIDMRESIIGMTPTETLFLVERSTGICTRVPDPNDVENSASPDDFERFLVRHYKRPERALESFLCATVDPDRYDDEWFDQLAHGYDNYDSRARVPVAVCLESNNRLVSSEEAKGPLYLNKLDYILDCDQLPNPEVQGRITLAVCTRHVQGFPRQFVADMMDTVSAYMLRKNEKRDPFWRYEFRDDGLLDGEW
jgi:hypothetical protein